MNTQDMIFAYFENVKIAILMISKGKISIFTKKCSFKIVKIGFLKITVRI